MTYLPITLAGNNLGERHRHLNSLVNDAYVKKVPFQSIQNAPESSAVDRLFKIDLASKLRQTNYIFSNLKDTDMLYVSRALQLWLLEPQYQDVMNPTYLESLLYPDMTTTAVNKMNNWLHVHLKDPARCLEFFQYYSGKNFDLALKFLWNCPENVIADTIAKSPKKITPKRMKLLCEKCPRAVRTFYEAMSKDKDLVDEYLHYEGNYFRCLSNLINTDSDLLLDIAEKYYNSNCCNPFSSALTRVVMSKHKDRYIKKPELYAAWLLHTPTLAKFLNNDEIKDIVLRLARAEYLGSYFFTYKRVEPLIKRLSWEEREAFKKLVFVDKCVSNKVKDWPYPPPKSPFVRSDLGHHVFEDNKFEPYGGGNIVPMSLSFRCGFMKRGCRLKQSLHKVETLLDKLFNKYRCINFKNTFTELSKQIPAESSVQMREYMMLVLVSKTGGRVEYVKEVLELLSTKHNNEADNFRATIVRSLVKRANVWRLPNDIWQLLIRFAHGLGLDGEYSSEKCYEGLHAVVLRNVLLDEECSPKVLSAFIDEFSTFSEYNLNEDEKRSVVNKLPFMLLASAKEQTDINKAIVRLQAVMNVLKDYKLKINHCPELLPLVTKLARQDTEACVMLLQQLYYAKIARKDLFRENFTFLQRNASYLNVLRHDSEILKNTDKFDELVNKKLDHDIFLRKLAIYFSENQGLAQHYLSKIDKEIAKDPRADLSRSFAILAGSTLLKRLQEVDSIDEKTTEQKRLAAALRAYGHLARPQLDLNVLGWRKAGVKAVANQISICSINKVDENIKLLCDWPRAARLSYLLAERIGREVEVLARVARSRPTVAIKIIIRHLRRRGETFDQKIWETGKDVLEHSDLSQPKHSHIRDRLFELKNFPESIRADYGAIVYKVLRKVSQEERVRILSEIEDYLTKADEKFFIDLIQEFLDNELTFEKAQNTKYPYSVKNCLIIRIIAKYLLLCKSEDIQKQRFETIGRRFLSLMKTFFDEANNDAKSKDTFLNYWKSFMYSLKYTDVFMDTAYVSCLPVLQHIVEWLKDTMPIVEYVDSYITMHLIMLYYKAIRQSIKQNPLIFSDKTKTKDIGVDIVSFIYGKYITHEVIQLKAEYFESIVEIYAKVLIDYFSAAFHAGKSFGRFVSGLIKGMLEEKDSTTILLAEKVFLEYMYSLNQLKDDKILELLKANDDKQLKFFLSADFEDNIFDECY